MTGLLDHLVALETTLSVVNGDFWLFGLFLREDHPDAWDLVVAAPWIDRDPSSATRLIADAVQKTLPPDEILQISRIAVVNADNPALDAITRSLTSVRAVVELKDTVFSGLPIVRAYVITSKKQGHLDRSGAVAFVPDHSYDMDLPHWSARLAALESQIETHPKDATLFRKAAYCALHVQEFAKALSFDKKATELDPDLAMAWVGRVVAASFIQNSAEVDRSYRELAKRSPMGSRPYVEATHYYAKSLFQRGRYDDAIPLFRIVAESQFDVDEPYMTHLQREAQNLLTIYDRKRPRRRR